MKLGNLGPGETAQVTIAYAQPTDRDPVTGTLSVVLPVVLNPRYIPRQESPPAVLETTTSQQEMFTSEYFYDYSHYDYETEFNSYLRTLTFQPDPTFLGGVPFVSLSETPYTLDFSADIDLGSSVGISEVKSGNEADSISVEYGNGNASVKLLNNFTADHDFQLFIKPVVVSGTVVYVEPGIAGEGSWNNFDVVALWTSPTGESSMENSNDEYWIIIDRSGSMVGSKISDARKALGVILKSLPVGCTFNIIGFGSSYRKLFTDA